MESARPVQDLKKQTSQQKKREGNPTVEQCKDYIFKHLHEKIRIPDIARELYLNPNYLSNLFRRHEGISIVDFVAQEKLKLVKNLLTYSNYSYIEIASYLGFSSQSHLGKQFKAQTGMTLKQYHDKSAIYSKKSKSAQWACFTLSAQVNPTIVPVNSPYLQYSSENLVVSKTRPIFS